MKSSVIIVSTLFCAAFSAAKSAGTNISPGRQVLLNRGLQIQSLGFVTSTPAAPTNYTEWASAHFTTFNSWNDQNAEKTLGWTMPWSRWMKTDGSNPITNNEKTQHSNELVSLQYGDELNQDGTGTIDPTTLSAMTSNYFAWHGLLGTNFIAYSNFGANNASKSMTPAGLSNYMAAANPDMLMFDAYPLQYVSLSTWYAEMQKYRLAGLAGIDGTGRTPIPCAQYLDLYRTSFNASLPDESFVRLQEFASWAFGYTFVTAFVYNQPNNPTVYPALFSAAGDANPTTTFSQVAQANQESLNLGPALIRLISTDIRMIPGTGNSLPSGISAWSIGAGGNSYITSITPVTNPGGGVSSSYHDILVGYLDQLTANNAALPFADGPHFMLVNAASSGAAAAQAQWYHITFDFTGSIFDSLQVLNRNTGQMDSVPLTHVAGSQYTLDWNLAGGTGDLFRFWSASGPSSVSATLFPPHLDSSRNLIISGTNATGLAGGTYSVLSSVNLSTPRANWMTNATGVFGPGGSFTSTAAVELPGQAQYFLVRIP